MKIYLLVVWVMCLFIGSRAIYQAQTFLKPVEIPDLVENDGSALSFIKYCGRNGSVPDPKISSVCEFQSFNASALSHISGYNLVRTVGVLWGSSSAMGPQSALFFSGIGPRKVNLHSGRTALLGIIVYENFGIDPLTAITSVHAEMEVILPGLNTGRFPISFGIYQALNNDSCPDQLQVNFPAAPIYLYTGTGNYILELRLFLDSTGNHPVNATNRPAIPQQSSAAFYVFGRLVSTESPVQCVATSTDFTSCVNLTTLTILKTVRAGLPLNCTLSLVVPPRTHVTISEPSFGSYSFDNLEGCCEETLGPFPLYGLISNTVEFSIATAAKPILPALRKLHEGICLECVEQFCITCETTGTKPEDA